MRQFQGRIVTPGKAKAEAVVTHAGFNTLASLQKSLQFGDKTAKVNDQNNPELYGKPIAGKALLRLRHEAPACLHALCQPYRLSGSRRRDPGGCLAGRYFHAGNRLPGR